MKKADLKKQQWLEDMSNYVLDNGLSTISLRPLAKAIGTSDRMLIYHFESKENLIIELLQYMTSNIFNEFSKGLPSKQPETKLQCVEEIMSVFQDEKYQKYMRLWFDIISNASQNKEPYKQTSLRLTEESTIWVQKRLPFNEENPEKAAKALLTLIEGSNIMHAIGYTSARDEAIYYFLK